MNERRDENGLLLARTSGGPANGSSRYLGVTYQGQCANRPWRAMVWDREHKRNRSLGGFVTEIEAAQAVTDYKDGKSVRIGQNGCRTGLPDPAEEMVRRQQSEISRADLAELGLEIKTHWICRGCGAEAEPAAGRCRKCGANSFERCPLSRKGEGR